MKKKIKNKHANVMNRRNERVGRGIHGEHQKMNVIASIRA